MRLTVHMHTALQAAARPGGVRRVHQPDTPGRPPWPHPAATLHALVRNQLATKTIETSRKGVHVEVWTITQHGHTLLNPAPVVLTQVPRFLSRPSRTTGDYTSNPGRSIDELEAVDAPQRFVRQSRALHEAEKDRRRAAREAARLAA